jgi:hypothetical protein
MASTDRAVAAVSALRKAALPYTGQQSAEYTVAILKSLGTMALQTEQPVLAHLLDMAAAEARWIALRSA